MVSTENKEIKVTASDALEFEPVLREQSQGGGWGLKIFLTLIVVGGGAGAWVLYGDTLLQRLSGGDGAVPLIKAAAGPIKVRPENPGGLKVPNRDKLVYDRMQKASNGGTDEGRAPERLLPPPEQPLPKPKFKPSAETPAETKAPEKLAAAPEATPKPVKTPAPAAKANPVAKVPTLKDVNTAKRPTPPPPPPAPPASGPRSPASGSLFSEPASKATATAKPIQAVPVRKPAKVAAKTPASAPKPVASPIGAPATRISRDKAYLVQLAAARSSRGAREEWQRLRTKHLDLLGRLGLTVTKADLGPAKGIFYRLRAGPLADEGTARSLCKQLARRQVGCLVVKPMQ